MEQTWAYIKNYGGGILVAVLLLLTFATLPRIDYVEPDVFFYVSNLPVVYYVSLIASIIVALITQNRFVRIFSVIAFTLLIILTPSVMFVNPWHMDSYVFTAEGVYVQRNSELAPVHYLSESPALGLFLGAFFMITGIDSLVIMTIYPSVVAIVCALLVYAIAEKFVVDKKSAVLAPLCLVAIMWPNAFHVSRQSFVLIYYLASWLCLYMLLKQSNRKIAVLLVIQIILMVIAHPATPIFFMTNLIAILLVGGILRKVGRKQIISLIGTLGFCAIFWAVWNSQFTSGEGITVVMNIITNLIDSLIADPTVISGTTKIFVGYTSIYSSIINTRLYLTGVVALSGLLLALITYRYNKNFSKKKTTVILMSWLLSNMASAVPLMYGGLPYFARPVLFTFISFAPLVALFCDSISINSSKTRLMKSTKMKNILKYSCIVIFIIVPALLIPIIKYAPLPFLYPTTRELSSIKFTSYYMADTDTTLFEMTTPWGYDYLKGYNTTSYLLIGSNLYSNGSVNLRVAETTVIFTYRLAARDAFYEYEQPRVEVIENITQEFLETHNKIYDAGWPYWIMMPKSELIK